MRKLNALFSILVACLCFNTLWNHINNTYRDSIGTIGYNSILSNELDSYWFTLSNHFIEDETRTLLDDIMETTTANNLNISLRIYLDNGLQPTDYIFTNIDNPLMYDHLLSEPIDIKFNDTQETRYLTTNPKDSQRDAQKIYFLNRNDIPSLENSVEATTEIRPLAQTSQFLNEKAKTQWQLYVLSNHDGESVKQIITQEIMVPYNLCDESSCVSERIGGSERLNIQQNAQPFSLLRDPFVTPKPYLYLSLFCLYISLIYTISKNAKEIAIRQLHGNDMRHIFLKICLPDLLVIVLSFMIALMINWLVFVRAVNHLAISFTLQLLQLTLIIGIVTSLMFGLTYLYIKRLPYNQTLNASIDAPELILNTNILKICLVILLLIPIIDKLDMFKQSVQSDRIIMHNDDFQKSYLVTKPVQPIMWTDQNQDSSWEKEMSEQLIVYIRAYQIGVLSIEDALNNENQTMVTVNNHYLQNFEIRDSDGNTIEPSALTRNTYLVPEGAKVPMGISKNEVIHVQKTPELIMSITRNTAKNEIIKVLVNDYRPFNVQNFDMRVFINNQEDLDRVKAFNTTVSKNISLTHTFALRDQYEHFQIQGRYEWFEMISLISIALIMFIIFDILAIFLYMNQKRKTLAIKYVHGFNQRKRYRFISLITLATTMISTTLTYRYFIKQNPDSRAISPHLKQQSFIILVFLMTLDCLILIIQVNNFEKRNTASSLKGNES